MSNYEIVYGDYILTTIPGYLHLGKLDSEPTFYFKIPIFQDILPHTLAKHLTQLSVTSEIDEIQYGQLMLKKEAGEITMLMNTSTFIFINKKHVKRFIKCLPIMSLQAAIESNLFRALASFCSKLYATGKWETILKEETENQFAVASAVLFQYFGADFHEIQKNAILVFIEIHSDLINSVLHLQTVVKQEDQERLKKRKRKD